MKRGGEGEKSEEEEAGNEKGGRRKVHVRTGAKEAAKTGARAQPDRDNWPEIFRRKRAGDRRGDTKTTK